MFYEILNVQVMLELCDKGIISSSLLEDIVNVIGLVLSCVTLKQMIDWRAQHEKEKEIDTRFVGKEEILKNKQSAYISLNKIFMELEEKKLFNPRDAIFAEHISKMMLPINGELGFKENLEKMFSIYQNFSGAKIFNKTSNELYVFYKNNAFYFSEEIEKEYIKIMNILWVYEISHLIILNKILLILRDSKRNISGFKKQIDIFTDETYFIMCYFLEKELREPIEKIHNCLINEIANSDFSINLRQKYPQHISYFEKDSLTESIFNGKHFTSYHNNVFMFIESKFPKEYKIFAKDFEMKANKLFELEKEVLEYFKLKK